MTSAAANKRVLISGASGLIGRSVISALEPRGWHIDALVRSSGVFNSEAVTEHVVTDLATADPTKLWPIISNVSCILHLAAIVPGKQQSGAQDKTVEMARILATAAAQRPDVRMIHMSSAYASLAECSHTSARQYGHSKLQAEIETQSVSPTFQQLIILRPPVVYGEGMSGAMSTLVALIKKGVPLPFGRADEKRAYISKSNLVDLLVKLITAPIDNQLVIGCKIYEPSDGIAVSTHKLIQMLAEALGTRPLLLPVPLWFLRLAGKMVGRSGLISGAIEPLQLHGNALLEADFGWAPLEHMPDSLYSWLGKPIGR
jgi:UDP-glucose 4-epimerase